MDGQTPLFPHSLPFHAELVHAALIGDLEHVKVCIEERGVPIEAVDQDGTTPLIAACFGVAPTCIDVLQYLLASGANINHVQAAVSTRARAPAHGTAM